MKIAVYSGTIPSTTFIENLIEVLSEDGFEVYLFGKRTKEITYKKNVRIFSTPDRNISLIFFVIKESLKLMLKSFSQFLEVFETLSENSKSIKVFFKKAGFILPVLNNPVDVFHIQWAKTVQVYPELYEILKCKIVLSLRGAHINYSPVTDKALGESYRKYFPLTDGFHAVSQAIGKEAMKYGAEKEKIKVIHSSVKDELLKINSSAYKSNENFEIVSVGRHHWKKGYHYALDAMKILKDEGVEFKYTIIAQGELPEEIIFMLDDYNLKNYVSVIKGMPYNELIKYLEKCHLLLLPSVEEGIANVVLEAMAAGVPVLTTDCGGVNEVITDRLNGYIIPVRDPDMIVKKVKEFLKAGPEIKSEMILRAKETINNEFSREKQIKDFRVFYKFLMNK